MTACTAIAGLIDELKPKSGPLIITVFGDAIAPRSNDIWLGSLIVLLSKLGLSERLVRTGVYRLARDGWLESRSRGRRSYYNLTAKGRATFSEADARIYATHAPAWNGQWTLVNMLPGMVPGKRRALRETLRWHGFGQLSPLVMVKPQRDAHRTETPALADVTLDRHVSVFSGKLEHLAASASLQDTARAAWDIDGLNASYLEFIGHFAGFRNQEISDPADCFALRTLLIHEFRRTLLRDPQLPSELLPRNWSGEAARNLTSSLYHVLVPAAETFITGNFENWDQTPTSAKDSLRRRFA